MIEVCNICIDNKVLQPYIPKCGCKNNICQDCLIDYKYKLGDKCLFNCDLSQEDNDLSQEDDDVFYDLIHYIYYNGL